MQPFLREIGQQVVILHLQGDFSGIGCGREQRIDQLRLPLRCQQIALGAKQQARYRGFLEIKGVPGQLRVMVNQQLLQSTALLIHHQHVAAQCVVAHQHLPTPAGITLGSHEDID
ncbi:hypothetical protein D3C81_1855970 [compost metagenome]